MKYINFNNAGSSRPFSGVNSAISNFLEIEERYGGYFATEKHKKKLNSFYEKLYESSNKYILLIEYFSPVPTEMKYRGHDEKLFKRDFAKELWSKYENLQLIDYGFFWSMDEICNGDDTNWFLFQK